MAMQKFTGMLPLGHGLMDTEKKKAEEKEEEGEALIFLMKDEKLDGSITTGGGCNHNLKETSSDTDGHLSLFHFIFLIFELWLP